MAGIKIQRFLGKAPRTAPELLPNTAAQIATNVKLYSGDLIPYPAPVVAGNHGLVGSAPKTLHALYDPNTGDPVWLVWDKPVDIATPVGSTTSADQRFYYTGDENPKVSTYQLATSGSQPYPVDYYNLGLSLPDTTPTATATAFTTKSTSSYERDSGGVVTLKTLTAHGLKSGAFVSVSGFTNRIGTYGQIGTVITVTISGHGLSTGASVVLRFTSGNANSNAFTVTGVTTNTFTVTANDTQTTSGTVQWDITNLNALSAKITVIDSTTFTYIGPGFPVAQTLSNLGRVDLAGDTQARSYVWTWYTPWDEESVPSEPSEALFIKEGQTVTVSNLPTQPPTNFVSVPTGSETGVTGVITIVPGKNFIRGIRLYRSLSSASDTEFLRLADLWFPVDVANVTGTTVTTVEPHNLRIGSIFKISTGVAGGEVTDITDEFTFEYSGGSGSGGTGGVLYHDVSENPGTTTPRYWGDGGNFDFVDDFDFAGLGEALTSDEYDPPPPNLKGLTVYNNNILVGFTGNEVYFSEPGKYHAWPPSYKQEIPFNIVGLATFAGYLLVLTEDYPYIIAGTDPAVLTVQRVDAQYPCLNKNSIVNMNFGVMYATHDGLVLYSTSTGPQLATRLIYNSDTWNEDLDPSTITASSYKDTYLAWHSAGGLSFERDDQIGGYFVDLDTPENPEATWYNPRTNELFYTRGTAGDVYLWDAAGQAKQTYEWKSKIIVTPDPINLGAAQIDADYEATSPVWSSVEDLWNASTTPWFIAGGITFRLWVDNQLIFTRTLDNRGTFRLPAGYRADKFEVGVEGAVRLRSITLAETPIGLKAV